VGEQYIDLFAAGAYALEARLLQALAEPTMVWIFYVLAAAGIVVSIVQSALEGTTQLWLRHLVTVAVASVLILKPHRIELADLTYAAPGTIEELFGTRTGAAPHLTYLVERFGAIIASRLRDLMHTRPVLAVPTVASQVDDLASDPATLSDAQVRANLQIWRDYIVPRLFIQHPELATALREANLMPALLNPAPSDDSWVGPEISTRAATVRTLLASSGFDLAAAVADESALLCQVTDSAAAEPWVANAGSVRIPMALEPPPAIDPPLSGSPAYYDAVARGNALARSMIDQLPQAAGPSEVARIEQLHDLLGRSILYAAAVSYLRQDSRLATLGSYCQRLGEAACRSAQAPLIQASAALRVTSADRYNTASFTTWLKQPLATMLLTVASLILGALSLLIAAVLPFLLGVAKAIAILMSSIGLWMMLWPGRLRDALSWMVLPVAFVALWSLLFQIWADVESFLSAIASIVSHSDYGSFSAGRIMSIAISLGYLGLPAVALSILSGNALRALNHASGRLETALLVAWRTRRTFLSFSRRWLANSPLARRWNQRVYRAVGLGTLRSIRPPAPRSRRSTASAAASSPAATRARPAAGTAQEPPKKPAGTPPDFKLK
jgi:hypothetical protein